MYIFSSFEFFSPSDGLLVQRLTSNLEDQVICDRGFLPLAFDKSISSSKAADATLVRPGYFISPVPAMSGEQMFLKILISANCDFLLYLSFTIQDSLSHMRADMTIAITFNI